MKTLHIFYILYIYRSYNIRGRALIRCYILMHFISAADRYTRGAYYNIRIRIIPEAYKMRERERERGKKTSKQIARALREQIYIGIR